jgi:hypothetical protein
MTVPSAASHEHVVGTFLYKTLFRSQAHASRSVSFLQTSLARWPLVHDSAWTRTSGVEVVSIVLLIIACV